jgi:hypothetical protein
MKPRSGRYPIEAWFMLHRSTAKTAKDIAKDAKYVSI